MEQDAEFRRALRADRDRLRKLAHWSGALSVSSIATRGDHLGEVVMAPGAGVSAGDTAESILVTASAGAAPPSMPRWSSVIGGDVVLPAAPRPVDVVIDGEGTRGALWELDTAKLVVVERGETRYEVCVRGVTDVELAPLDEVDQVGLAWDVIPGSGGFR